MNGRMVIHLTVLLFLWFSHSLETIDSNSNPRISHLNCIELERKALLEIKDSLIDPLGQLSTWSGFDCCSWTGIFCDSQTHHVIKLDLKNRHTQPYIPSGLGGMLSLALLNLKHLNYLDLSRNDFYKMPIPSFIGSLENLNHLDLSLTRFEGEVPPQLGNLSSLQYLKLTTLTLWVKDLNWVSSLGSLRYIDLSGVDLSRIENNWLQPFSMIPSLKELHLRFCNLNYSQYSTLIDFSIANLTSLSVVDLSGNFFDSVPRWLFNITSLRQLGLLRSNIKGPIFQLPWRILCKLQILYLSHNTINDDIGKFIHALSECGNSSLQRLTLQNNHFMGDLGELVRIRNLRSLRLYDNWISGPIPFSIGNLSFLEELDFSYNKMNGSIPESLGNLAELIHLDIEQNFWDGALTGNHLRSLKKLEILAISSANKGFVFDVPSYWVPPFNLKSITISDCNLGPDFPPWLRTQTNISSIVLRNVQILEQFPNWFWNMTSQITELDLSSNQIEGVLPKNMKFSSAVIVNLRHNRLRGTIPLWSNVPRLFLGNNSFHGPIPSEIGCAMSSVRVLDLSHNSISGSIPLFICEMKNLVSLDLSDNNLSGEILNIWKALPNLRRLDLSENNLYGKIPSSICSLPSINWLMMSGNNLSGELSLFLQNCTSLEKIDLGDNQFSGSIPTWFGENLLSLKVLSLRSNLLSGEIPHNLCRLSHLHALDLSQNKLTGTIPTCFANMKGFYQLSQYNQLPPYLYYTYVAPMNFIVKGKETEFTLILDLVCIIDLSNNSLWGEIPSGITNLLTLGTLNLSRNHLAGRIPENIGDLRLLETLDLSFNYLSGQIPSSMSTITSLSHLNLSFNNLSGPIPSSNQFWTFTDKSIYEGNVGLCGPPLSLSCFQSDPRDGETSGTEEEDEMFWVYVSTGLGYLFGFLVIVVTFLIRNSCANDELVDPN